MSSYFLSPFNYCCQDSHTVEAEIKEGEKTSPKKVFRFIDILVRFWKGEKEEVSRKNCWISMHRKTWILRIRMCWSATKIWVVSQEAKLFVCVVFSPAIHFVELDFWLFKRGSKRLNLDMRKSIKNIAKKMIAINFRKTANWPLIYVHA